MEEKLLQLVFLLVAGVFAAVFSYLKKVSKQPLPGQAAGEEMGDEGPDGIMAADAEDRVDSMEGGGMNASVRRAIEDYLGERIWDEAKGTEAPAEAFVTAEEGDARYGTDMAVLDTPQAAAFTPIDRAPEAMAGEAYRGAAVGYGFIPEEEGRLGQNVGPHRAARADLFSGGLGRVSGRRIGNRAVNLRDAIVYDAILRRSWGRRAGGLR